ADDDQQALRAALPRRERLVSKVGVAGERGLRLRIRVFREVVEDEDDLVLHVEACVAVVAEPLRFRHNETVAGKYDRPVDRRIVREGERLHLLGTAERLLTGAAANRQRRSTVARPRGELE